MKRSAKPVWIDAGIALPNEGEKVLTTVTHDNGSFSIVPQVLIGGAWHLPNGKRYIDPTHWLPPQPSLLDAPDAGAAAVDEINAGR